MREQEKPQQNQSKRRPPATTPEARENQIIEAAYDLAEKQIRAGTASSQVLTEFLKRGSRKEKLEREILEHQKELIVAKTKSIQSGERIEQLYKDAMNAMRTYTGNNRSDENE